MKIFLCYLRIKRDEANNSASKLVICEKLEKWSREIFSILVGDSNKHAKIYGHIIQITFNFFSIKLPFQTTLHGKKMPNKKRNNGKLSS